MTLASVAPTIKAFWTGTHRVRLPEETWDIMRPKLPRFGITRVADVTGLDILGIPVVMAMRPLAKLLSVSQGKGQTATLAAVSGAMESIEMWHAENAVPAAAHPHTPARELMLPYRMRELLSVPGGLVTEDTPLDWVDAVGMATGRTVPLPVVLVGLTAPHEQRWHPGGLRAGSNGLASGNCGEEAALHALYEVIERDVISQPDLEDVRVDIDPRSITDSMCGALLDRVHSAGATVRIFYVPNRFRVPCFGARIWTEDFPVVALGWGAHLAAEVAVSRALTEAAQSRLASLVGSREDLPAVYEHVRRGAGNPLAPPEEPAPWADVTAGDTGFTDIADELRTVSRTVAEVAGAEPLLVDLSTEDDFAVARVVLPGAKLDVDRVHPKGQPEVSPS
jgi:ribosomal protein S12 methylthiotransferase accessory factor